MPVHKCSIGILFPGPDVQRIESGKSESIRALEVMKQLSHQLGRAGVCCIPLGGDNQEVCAGELQMSIWLGFVDHDLGTCRIQDSATNQISVHIVETHGTCVWSAHAAKLKVISFG